MPTIEEIVHTDFANEPYRRLALNLIYTGDWMQQIVAKATKPFGISEPQYNVLRTLERQNGVPMNLYEIQERMMQRTSNVSRLIDKLEEKGLVDRKKSLDNKRRVEIVITAKGLELLAEAVPRVQEQYQLLFTKIGADECIRISNLLDDVHNDKQDV